MKTTNTNGMIAAAKSAPAAAQPKATPANKMRCVLDSKATKALLQNTLKENAGAFSASVLELFNNDTKLQACGAEAVFTECLKAASLKLPINKQLGFAYVIPYKGTPQFQLGYRGMIQLCLRTGAYKYINAGVVYEGEYLGENKLTGEVDLSGDKTSDKIVGYFAYIETINGFKKSIYWDYDRTYKHAKKFSKSFDSANSVWKTDFDAMAIKTVLRNLISHYGIMSVEMANAVTAEDNAGLAAGMIEGAEDNPDIIIAEETSIQQEPQSTVENNNSEIAPDDYPFG